MKKGCLQAVLSALPLFGILSSPAAAGPAADRAGELLQKGDRVVLIGNTFAERLLYFGNFETLLTLRHSELDLSVRNLGWPADTLSLQPRPLNFGDMWSHLEDQKADVIIACFGLNEAFEGPSGLARFEQDLETFLKQAARRRLNGRSPPRLILVSPIAHEDLGRPFPDPSRHNRDLEQYTGVMKTVAGRHGARFVDLFTPTRGRMQLAAAPRLTFNGIHLSAYGDWVVSQLMLDALASPAGDAATPSQVAAGGVEASDLPLAPPAPPASGPEPLRRAWAVSGLSQGRFALNCGGPTVLSAQAGEWASGVVLGGAILGDELESLRLKIVAKNREFFYRWRAVNGEYIYGRRAEPFGVISFPPEFQQMDKTVSDLEKVIWAEARRLAGRSCTLVRSGH